MDNIVRQRIRGRKLNIPFGPGRIKANWAENAMGKPVGYKHTSLAAVPMSHVSSHFQQDLIEEQLKRKIAHTPAGPRRDFLIRDLDMWQKNNRPTAGSWRAFDRAKGRYVKTDDERKAEPVRTWRDGKPLYADYSDMLIEERQKRVRQLLGV